MESHMNLFKTFTLKWWQGALFKWGVFALGIAAGAGRMKRAYAKRMLRLLIRR